VGERNGRREIARAQLHAEVVPEFTVEPAHVDFGVLSPGESRTRIVAIRPRACANFVVQSARSTHRGFNLSLDGPAGSGANNCWELTVRCEAPATPGRQAMSGLAILETSSLRVPRLQVPLLALPCAMGVARWPRLGLALAVYSMAITTLATLTDACPEFHAHPNPLLDLHLPLLGKGEFSPNLGMVLGLSPYASVALYYALLVGGAVGLWRRLRETSEARAEQGSSE
jgi:hypothetical protein